MRSRRIPGPAGATTDASRRHAPNERKNRSGTGCPKTAGAAGPRIIVALFVTLVVAVSLPACSSGPGWGELSGENLFAYAVEAYEDEDWGEAIEALEALVFRQPGYEGMAEARMYLARAHFQNGEFITSAAEFQRFLDRYPSHGLAPEASLGICRSYAELAPHPQRDQDYTEQAVITCRATSQEFAGFNVAEEAQGIQNEMFDRLAESLYLQGRHYQRRNFHDSAILYFQDLVDFYPQTSWAAEGFLALYRSYSAIGWEEEADRARRRLLDNYPDSEAAQGLMAEDG